MRVRLSATQPGLSQYHWVIKENSVVVADNLTTQDVFEYQSNRPASTFPDLSVEAILDTRNFANCASTLSTGDWVVPNQDDINASFTASPPVQSLPSSTVTITNTTIPGPWQYSWDFGDGTTSTTSAASFTHDYATYGKYVITLTVTMNVCVETHAETVQIDAIPPLVDFAYDPPSGCTALTVNFTNLSKYADVSTYAWDFGDGNTTSQTVDPTYTYHEPGVYTVSLSASNITGQVVTETKSMIIEVFPLPVADFAVKPELLYIPGDVLYTSNRCFGASAYLWDFGDSFTSTEIEPTHVYKNEGQYDITLIAYTSHNCSDTAVHVNGVRVQKGGQVLVPNAFSPNTAGQGSASNGKNDIFLPMLRGVTEFELLIFNRWGELLFESHDQNTGWDGYFNGHLCPQDVYVYRLTAQYDNGEKTVRVGDINLIR
jgi:gliding motility-associated-like protein